MSTRPKPDLDILLAGHQTGTWVVLDAGMSKVLGAAPTPEGAMRKANISPTATGPAGNKRPVMMRVPDPTMACFF
jgi:hypothetical protein